VEAGLQHAVAFGAPAPHACKRCGSIPAAQETATERARERATRNTVVRGEKEVEREKGGERRIKYEIVGIEYGIEITRVREKWI